MKKILLTSLAFVSPLLAGLTSAQVDVTQIASWKEVGSFSVNPSETYIVFSQVDANGVERAFEASKSGTEWQQPTPIQAINSMGSNVTVGGLFLSDDCRTIFFHAKTEGSTSGYDIYRSDKQDGQWGKPQKVESLSSSADDLYPSVTSGEREAYILRHQVSSDEKKERKEFDKLTIYSSKKNAADKWQRPQPVNPAVSYGFVQDARIARDGSTFYYAIRADRKEKSLPMFSRKGTAGDWLIPESLVGVDDEDFFSPQITDKHLWYIVPSSKKSRYGLISFQNVSDPKFKCKPTVTESGKVLSKGNKVPVRASIDVLDPTTSTVVAHYDSRSDDGSFHMVLPDKSNYIVNVRSDGYSFAPYMLSYDGSGQRLLPQTIELFDTIQLGITLYDAEIFRPIEGKVIAVRQTDKAIFRSVQAQSGYFVFNLPLGSDYNIIATDKRYDENKFLFKLGGDIVFDHFERELAMEPRKRNVTVRVLNAATKNIVPADVTFVNNMREEKLVRDQNTAAVNLREGDSYSVTVMPPSGYSFKNFTLDLRTQTENNIDIEVIELKQGASLELNNIVFETGSAFLLPEAHAELERLLELLRNNPDLKVEISAHTDNVGSASYNLVLSNQRAASVVAYLVDNGIDPNKLISKGYGLTKPLVPNTSDENRQKNRRVEFAVIGQAE